MSFPAAVLSRYESLVDRLSTPDGCHPWSGFIDPDGYGRWWALGRAWQVHRFGWTAYVGDIPKGIVVRHYVCDNPPCQNLKHLRLGTVRDNNHDMARKGRAHGPLGPLGPYNTGSTNGLAKLTEAQVVLIREAARLRPVRGIQAELAREFGVHPETVRAVITGRTWAHVPQLP